MEYIQWSTLSGVHSTGEVGVHSVGGVYLVSGVYSVGGVGVHLVDGLQSVVE